MRRRLVTLLFICLLLPVLIVLAISSAAVISERHIATEMSGRFVRDLAVYGADQWNGGNPDRIEAFLSLLRDHGYESLIDQSAKSRIESGKFVPGMVAYVTLAGRVIAHSQNAGVLRVIFEKALAETGGRIVGADGHIEGAFRSEGRDISYVAYIAPTDDPRVYAVAAVSLLSWMGRNDFALLKLGAAGAVAMIICLVAIFLIRSSVLAPLRSLSDQVDTLNWGVDRPSEGPRGFGEIGVEEIASLKKAVASLADRMIEKNELEARYVGDIVKAQEEERGRIAQDIHDGPIQVLSALIQKIQIAGLSLDSRSAEDLLAIEGMANDLVSDLRDICDSLVPPWVSLGIVSCIEESAARMERQYAISISADVDQDIELTQAQTLAMFRVFQEAVSNAVRHGHATEIRVEGVRTGSDVIFTITDDGTGFEVETRTSDELMREGKRGLNGMRQRINFLGGMCDITSSCDGTAIKIALPCDDVEARDGKATTI